VTVVTNIPDSTAPVTLTIQGEIWEPVGVAPRIVNFGQLNSETAREPTLSRSVTVTNNLEEPAELTDVHCTSALFHVETKSVEPGKKYELTVTIAGALQPGSNTGTIELSTGVAEMPTLRIPVQASLTPDVDVTPAQMTLPPTVAVDVKNQFTIRNHTQTPLDITDLTVSNPALQVELEEGQDGTSYILQVDVSSGAELSPAGEKITFKTGVLSMPEVTIPVTVRHAPATRPSRPASRPTTTRPGPQPRPPERE
jgi:hypothetical protein